MRSWLFGFVFSIFTIFSVPAYAQQTVWVQIEAQRSLGQAQTVARKYSSVLQSVSGFAMRSGWYAISLGPFSPADAADIMGQLKITRQIPGDAYIVDGSSYRRQFWPIGAAASNTQPLSTTPEIVEPEPAVVVQIVPSQETVAQARQSERILSKEERMLIQTALQWEGLYSSGIDGAIGPGTRKSMAAWQEREARDVTGVLTSLQRRDLIGRYQEMLASLGMRPITDNPTGITLDLPTAMVKFDRYEPPFAHFNSINDSGVRALLISQTGDDATLRGLYDIMQTLEIVPLDGARQIGRRNFTLSGENSEIASYTYAALADGHVKGFTLIWPAAPDRRRAMVINAMKNSFAPLAGSVLPDVYGDPNAAQSLDLLAGLFVRRPDVAQSGFYIDPTGGVITTTGVVQSCERLTLDDTYEVRVAAMDAETGLALLRPTDALAPIGFARLATTVPRLNAEIAVSGYSYGGALGAPTMTFGTLADLRGLQGETTIKRLSLNATQSDAGGPVLDSSGGVMGMLLPAKTDTNQTLPSGVRFATDASAIQKFLAEQGVEPAQVIGVQSIAPEDLTLIAADMTVLVSCWN